MSSLGLTLPQFATALMRELGMAQHPTPGQLQLLEYLQNGDSRKVLAAFRGKGKSTLAAMAALWWLDENPNEKILIVSASGGRAEDMASWMFKTIHDVPWLHHMRPDTASGRYSRIKFDVGTCTVMEQSPSVRAAGIYGQITGSRASKILADDVETLQTALTQVQRQKLRHAINEFEAILKPDPGAEIVFLGTPHNTTDSIYFHLRRSLGYSMRMWPARVPETASLYHGALAPLTAKRIPEDIGKPADTRFSDQELKRREESMTPMNWRLQFMLDPTLSDLDRYPLRCGDFLVLDMGDTVPEEVRYEKAPPFRIDDLPCPGMAHDTSWYRPAHSEGLRKLNELPCVMAIDPSGGGADEFAWAVLRVWNGNYFLLESGGRKGGVSEGLWQELALTCKQRGVNEILVETNFGDLSLYEQVMKPYLRKIGAECRFEPIRSNMQKERRIIDTLAPLLQTHRLMVDRQVVEADAKVVDSAVDEVSLSYSLFFQLTRISYDRGCLLHDDRLDALAMACAWFQEQAALDQKEQSEQHRMEFIEACLADEHGYCLMTADRLGLNMTVEQARAAGGRSGGSFLKRRG
jgi:hypothetical protein